MSERDWADELANTVFTVWTNTIVYEGKRDAVAAMLRNAHARGLREGAAAERQRAAGVCDRLASQWESGEQNRPYLQGMIGAAAVCRGAILCDPGAGPDVVGETPATQSHGPPVTADPAGGRCGGCRLWDASGYCRVARSIRPAETPAYARGTLRRTHRDNPCDIGEYRPREEAPGE